MPGESSYLQDSLLSTLQGIPYSTNVWLSLHTADPSGTGASEVSGGAYARVQITFSSPSAGVMSMNGTASINVPAGADVTYVGLWDSPTGGNFLVGGLLSPSVNFSAAGVLNLTSLTYDQTQ